MPNQIPINSKWRNPFPINKKTPDQEEERRVLIEFKEYLTNQPILLKQIPELKNKVLGCWCKPEACHGDILAELADADADELLLNYNTSYIILDN